MSGEGQRTASLVDSHCHLDLIEAQGEDLERVLAAARAAGVEHMLCAAVDLLSLPALADYARRYPGVFISAGVHPNERLHTEPQAEAIAARAVEARAVAIGETGLDYYRSTGELEWQRKRFRRHIAAARQARLPLIIHSREAREDTLAILEEEGAAEVGGVMHCFVEDWASARRAMDLGFYISFSGIVTFRNARPLKTVAARVPLERLLLETDSPYLTPEPYRGKPNQPGYVRYVAEHIAELRGTAFEAIAEATTHNFFALFTGATPTPGTS
jgi:TatD DNase family protein